MHIQYEPRALLVCGRLGLRALFSPTPRAYPPEPEGIPAREGMPAAFRLNTAFACTEGGMKSDI